MREKTMVRTKNYCALVEVRDTVRHWAVFSQNFAYALLHRKFRPPKFVTNHKKALLRLSLRDQSESSPLHRQGYALVCRNSNKENRLSSFHAASCSHTQQKKSTVLYCTICASHFDKSKSQLITTFKLIISIIFSSCSFLLHTPQKRVLYCTVRSARVTSTNPSHS